MPVPGTRLAVRLLEGAVDVVHQRAPGVSERAYRTVAGPLMIADPVGAARAVEARLDGTRERVAAMAARGSVPPAGARRVGRDLARARTDVEFIAPRLPVVQARSLVLRSAAYGDALQTLPARPQSRRAVNAVVLVLALAAWIGVLLIVASPLAAVLLGLVAGVFTASSLVAVHTRRSGRERIGAIVQALARADAVATGALPVPVPALDRARRDLLERADASGRLDERGTAALRAIDAHLDDLLVRVIERELQADGIHLVQATVERYLPDTLEPFLALPDAQIRVHERPAVVEVADQLVSIRDALANLVRRPAHNNAEQQLLRQGEFLRSKFGTSGPVA